jgi:L-lactate dehydrogenase (cytochrome)
LRVLPGIAHVLPGTIPDMKDGGIRRGSDTPKAIGLGVTFVFVGSPSVYAAAIAGSADVSHAIGILSTEADRRWRHGKAVHPARVPP